MNVILSSAYWPNLVYLSYFLHADSVVIEEHEHFQKQSYRNRCLILSANGTLPLTIPVQHLQAKIPMREIRISYQENWPKKHWGAIESAYKNSPYFEFFEDDIHALYQQNFEHLLAFNLAQLKVVLKLLKQKREYTLSHQFEAIPEGVLDLRERLHPKVSLPKGMQHLLQNQAYYQTFENKFAFIPNLSCLDLLFNGGLDSLPYLANLFKQLPSWEA